MTVPDLYDAAYYANMRESDRAGDKSLYAKFADLISDMPRDGLRVLDVGCGRGDLLMLLEKQGIEDIWGIDFSETAVEISRARLADQGVRRACDRVLCGSIADADLFRDKEFDVVFLTDVVEHLPQDLLVRGLTNVSRWLKPSGRIIIHTFPTLGPHQLFHAYLRLKGARDEATYHSTIHCNIQTGKSLRKTISEAGLVCQSLWLSNDFVETSSVYQSLPEGFPKRLAKFLAHDLPNARFVAHVLKMLGLEEYARPSIYCICGK